MLGRAWVAREKWVVELGLHRLFPVGFMNHLLLVDYRLYGCWIRGARAVFVSRRPFGVFLVSESVLCWSEVMPVGLLGRKVGMTQVYGDEGVVVPVTVLELGPCPVLQLRTLESDGYEAVQIGFGDKPRRLATRAERGHVAEISSKRRKRRDAAGQEMRAVAGCEPQRFVREFRTDGENHGLEVGAVLNAESQFEVGGRVDVVATSKGRGTAGVMKRHNFAGQRASHGVKKVHRHPGSIGQSADPSRVLKGTRMAGRYGSAQVTVRNLQIVRIIGEENLVMVKGAVPGPPNGFVLVRPTNKMG